MTDSSTVPAEAHRPWHVEVVADSDSRWKWGASVAARLAAGHGADLHATLLLGRSVPSDRQLADVGVTPATLRRAGIADTVDRLAGTSADVVVLACIGGCVQSLLHALARAWAGRSDRPVVVTGYVGLVYERVVDGLVNRVGADVVLANSAADARVFADVVAAVGADPATVVAAALPFLGGARHDPSAAGRTRPSTLTVVTQPGVPESRQDRRYLLRRAAEYAVRHPERRVLVKLRGRPGERTTHVEPYHYTSLLPAEALPPNLEFVYGAMAPVLDRTDLCVTVSSTVAIEAMHRGIPTGVLTDFGVRELLGNHLFLGSGAFTSWPALLRGEVPTVDPAWADEHGVVARPGALEHAYDEAARRVAGLVADRAALPPLRPWWDAHTAPAYLPALLARYGLDEKGVPVASSASAPAPLARRAVRTAARRAYGYGVRVVEPRIKRLAQW